MNKKIKVLIKADSRYPVDRKKIRRKVKKILDEKGLTTDIEVSIAFVGSRKIKKLNAQYRKKDTVTDVLSFPLIEGETPFPENKDNILRLGDVVICYPQARKQAMENNVLVDDEINSLVEHGILSLLGIHD